MIQTKIFSKLDTIPGHQSRVLSDKPSSGDQNINCQYHLSNSVPSLTYIWHSWDRKHFIRMRMSSKIWSLFQVFLNSSPSPTSVTTSRAIPASFGNRNISRNFRASAASAYSPSQHGDDPWLRFMWSEEILEEIETINNQIGAVTYTLHTEEICTCIQLFNHLSHLSSFKSDKCRWASSMSLYP